MRKPVCNALWVGPTLGKVEAACLSSFVAAGHRVDLYSYENPSGVPGGVTIVDANTIIPNAHIERYRFNGSPSLFSNRFRYALLAAGKGLWIDCDVLCLRPIKNAPIICGWQEPLAINGAVLKLPFDHPVLRDLRGMFTTRRWTPPWETWRRRLRWTVKYRLDPEFGLPDLVFGMTGPRALTHYCRKHRLLGQVRPVEAFYPIHWTKAELLTAGDVDVVTARIGPSTLCIHLWNQARVTNHLEPRRGSFLEAVVDGTWRKILDAAAVAV